MTWKASALVVANLTAPSDELLEALRAKAAQGPISYNLVVPAGSGAAGRSQAAERLAKALERFAEAGLEATGGIGDQDPVAAVDDAWDPREYDEVIVSTLPGASSKWLQVDLPHRIARLTGAPVTHVLSQEPRPAAVSKPVEVHEKPGVLAPLAVLTWGGGTHGRRPD